MPPKKTPNTKQWGLTRQQKKLVQNALSCAPKGNASTRWKWMHENYFSAFPDVSLTMVKNHGNSFMRSGGLSSPTAANSSHEGEGGRADDVVDVAGGDNATDPPVAKRLKQTPQSYQEMVLAAEKKRQDDISSQLNEGDPPFYIETKTSEGAPKDGLGAWFNKGNSATNVTLTVIHDLKLISVVKVLQPPNKKQFQQLPEKLFAEAKSMFVSKNMHGLESQKVECSVEIPRDYSPLQCEKFQTDKCIGLWFEKMIERGENFADEVDSDDTDTGFHLVKKKKKKHSLLNL